MQKSSKSEKDDKGRKSVKVPSSAPLAVENAASQNSEELFPQFDDVFPTVVQTMNDFPLILPLEKAQHYC